MTDEEFKKYALSLGELSVDQLAKDICSVQPMPADTFKKLYESAKSEEELIAEGYEPVCDRTRLTWRKK